MSKKEQAPSRRKFLRTGSLAATLAGAGLIAGDFIGRSQAAINPPTQIDGTGVSQIASAAAFSGHPYAVDLPPMYTIYRSGGTTYAVKSPDAPSTVASNSDSATVINNALTSLTSARTWREKVLVKGSHSISTPILMQNHSALEIEGLLTLGNTLNVPVIWCNNITDFEIFGGIVDGNKANQTSNTYSSVLYVSNTIAPYDQATRAGIGLLTSTNWNVHDIQIQNCAGEGFCAIGDNLGDTTATRGGNLSNVFSTLNIGHGTRTTKSMRGITEYGSKCIDNGQSGTFVDSSENVYVALISSKNKFGIAFYSITENLVVAKTDRSGGGTVFVWPGGTPVAGHGFYFVGQNGGGADQGVIQQKIFGRSFKEQGANIWIEDNVGTQGAGTGFWDNQLDIGCDYASQSAAGNYPAVRIGATTQQNHYKLEYAGTVNSTYLATFAGGALYNLLEVFTTQNGGTGSFSFATNTEAQKNRYVYYVRWLNIGINNPANVTFISGTAYTNSDGHDETIYYQDPNNATTTTVLITAASTGTTTSASILKGQLYTSPVLHPGDAITFTNATGMATVSGKVFS